MDATQTDKPSSKNQAEDEAYAAIRRFFEEDPVVPAIAKHLGMSAEELLAALEGEREPEFIIDEDYDEEADCAAVVNAIEIAERYQQVDENRMADGVETSPDDGVARAAPEPGARKGVVVDAPSDCKGLIDDLIRSRTKRRS